jgi:hypothetical protein
MVEVFKTDISERQHANMLVDQIHQSFPDYAANFDLEDCDRILRVKCTSGQVQSHQIIRMLSELGCTAEILPDDDQSSDEGSVVTPLQAYVRTKQQIEY